MTGLYYLAHLVQTKNDLNRRRRRFWHLMNPGREIFLLSERDSRYVKNSNVRDNYHYTEKPMHASYSKVEAKRGYERAKKRMRMMTKHMRKVRTEMNARFIWSDHGAISFIVVEGCRYSERDIRELALHHMVESILLRKDNI